jgi:serine/threonine-protein kinase
VIGKGQKVGSRYRVLGYVASGGMQDVYKALDELTEETVALKTPQVGQGNRRFHQSAQLSARINNYNVAKTFDYFEVEGACYLIEEFVDGTTLEAATLAKTPQVDPHMGAYLLLRVCKGLAASHAAGVAHRDLKPSNVLVGPALETVKITDFGIATLAEELFEEVSVKGDLTKSTSGTIKGALPYMAPEMIFRRAGDFVGVEADIWSLGAMMFRLLTGEYPFGEAMMVPVNVQNKTRSPWPAFMQSNPQFAPLARSLISIVEQCLAYDKASRPTAAELVGQCEDLCFFFNNRENGEIEEMIQSRGFVRSEKGKKVFFHSNSVYGSLRAREGSKVSFSAHPGEPFRRAHPLVVCA